MKKYFTSESVTAGHPDKVCDEISDAILDAYLGQDPEARVACECVAAKDFLFITGEVTADATVDAEKIARDKIREIGYTEDDLGFSADTAKVLVEIHAQSADIARGVNRKSEKDLSDTIGAGDQGMMFGYACRETPEYMPLTLVLAHKMCRRLEEVRKNGLLSYLRPDGKGQVTVEYEDGVPVRIDAVVLSSQHAPSVSTERLRADLKKHVIEAVLPEKYLDKNTKYFINPTGRFETGGPAGDTGLTGRKIIVDTYGGRCAHGGGCFSGKDPTKVDRSAAYMARYICKNIVAAGLADECSVEIAYAIGVARPVSVFASTYGTGRISDERLAGIIAEEFDLRPYAIIEKLGLRRPIYGATSVYGHFGREEFPWEKTDKAKDLSRYL